MSEKNYLTNYHYKNKYCKYKKKYLDLKNMIGGNYSFESFNFSEIKDFDCKDHCKIKDGKIISLKYKDLNVDISSKKVTLIIDQSEHAKFSIDNFDLYHSYPNEIIKILNNDILKSKKSYSVLALGFGLGGVPLKLTKFGKIAKIDTVDYNYDLFRIFKKIMSSYGIKVPELINYIYSDGVKYLEYCIKNGIKYDIIIDDLFNNEKLEYDYSLLYQCLNDEGILIMNVHNNIKDFVEKLKRDGYKSVEYIQKNEFLITAKK